MTDYTTPDVIQPGQEYWMIYAEGHGPPTRKYASLENAMQGADYVLNKPHYGSRSAPEEIVILHAVKTVRRAKTPLESVELKPAPVLPPPYTLAVSIAGNNDSKATTATYDEDDVDF